MASDEKFQKTEKGLDEVHHRTYKLAPRLRTILILVDGTKTMSTLVEQAAKLGVDEVAFMELEKEGFIAAVNQNSKVLPTENIKNDIQAFLKAQKFMNDTIVNLLGVKAFFLTLKLEKCSTLAELYKLMPDYEKAIKKATGEIEAGLLIETLNEIVNSAALANSEAPAKGQITGTEDIIEATRTFIKDYVLSVLGPDAATFLQEVERATSKEDLLVQAKKCRNLIQSFEGNEKADALWQRVQALLK